MLEMKTDSKTNKMLYNLSSIASYLDTALEDT